MGVIIPQIASAAEDRASGAQVIDGGLTFNKDKTTYLNKTPGTAGNTRTWTWSCWLQRTFINSGADFYRIFGQSETNHIYFYEDKLMWDMGSPTLRSNQLIRDIGWYHLVAVFDTTNGTSGDRMRLYLNGERITSFSSTNYPSANATGTIGSAAIHTIGNRTSAQGSAGGALSANISQVYFIDGQVLAPTEFGFTDPLTGIWRPKKFIPPYKPNSGQSWSGMCAGGTDSGYEHTKAFDGADNTNCYPSPGSTVTMTIPAGKLKYTTSFKAWVSRDINGGVITVNGGSNVTPSGSGFQIVDLSGQVAAGADITQITWARAGSGSIGIAMIYIMIDGVALLDDDYSNFGGNGFYLSMDGNSPIGQDKSRRGNDFTPINFGAYGTSTMNGSEASATVHIDTPGTGGLPILNTVSGGQVVTTGFRTDPYASSLVLAIPGAGDLNDYSATIKGSGTNKTVTNNGVTFPQTTSHYYGSAIYSDGSDSEFEVGSSTEADFAFAGEFTWEMWWYPISSGATTHARAWYFGMAEDDGGGAMHWYTSGNVNMLGGGAGGATSPLGTTDICTGTVTMDAWNHIAVTRDSANKVRVFLNGVLSGSTTNTNPVSSGQRTFKVGGPQYETAQYWQDIRLYNGACKYKENFNPGSPYPNVSRTSISGVAYSSELTKSISGSVGGIRGATSDYLSISSSGHSDFSLDGNFTVEWWYFRPSKANAFMWTIHDSNTSTGLELYWGSSGDQLNLYTNGSATNQNSTFRPGWSHYAVVRSGGTITAYYNGVAQSGTLSNSTTFSGNLTIGGEYYNGGITGGLSGPISNFRLVKGTAVYTSNFTPSSTPLTNITNTKVLCCQSSSSATAYAVSPGAITANGNAKASNYGPFDIGTEYALGRSSDYCIMNPADTTATLQDGGLLMVEQGGWGNSHARGTMAFPKGKWYYEATKTNDGGGDIAQFGFANQSASLTETYGSVPNNSWTFYWGNGREVICPAGNQGSYFGSGTATLPVGGAVGFAIDMDNNTWQCFREGIGGAILTFADTDNGSTANITELYPYAGVYNRSLHINFGQQPFKYPPPEGFQPLCSAGMDSPTFTRPDKYFTPTLYSGSGSGAQYVSAGFKPDMVWIKSRNNAWWWNCFDSVRGAGKEGTDDAAYMIGTNGTAAQSQVNAVSGTQFQGFYGKDTYGGYIPHYYTGGSGQELNTSGATYVGYCWKAGGNKNTFNVDDVGYATAAAAGLDAGTTNPTGASVGTKQGFSIIRYTGNNANRTIAHGLTKPPKFWIYKNLTDATNWPVNYTIFGSMRYIYLNLTNSQGDNSGSYWGNAPTSDVLYIGADNDTNGSGDDHILYLWHDVPGIQKFGQYKANNSTDGPYVSLGFKPALVCIKSATTSGSARNWALTDSTRSYANVANHTLAWNLNNPESDYGGGESVFGASNKIDLLSDGFKIRDTGNWCNESGATYIYMAWAESPFHNLYGGISNAR